MLYLGADHAGWQLKEEIKKYLDKIGQKYEDLGSKELDPKDDYPDFAFEVAKRVSKTNDKGVLICATGIGMCLAANKFKGVRAAAAFDEPTARQAKEHINANIFCIGAKTIDAERAKKLVKIWLETKFTGEERHVRRLKKIEEAEINN